MELYYMVSTHYVIFMTAIFGYLDDYFIVQKV